MLRKFYLKGGKRQGQPIIHDVSPADGYFRRQCCYAIRRRRRSREYRVASRRPPVILTDLIPYSHSYLLQGNIHHIATGGGSDGKIGHSGEEVGYVLDGEIELIVDGRPIVPRPGTLFTS